MYRIRDNRNILEGVIFELRQPAFIPFLFFLELTNYLDTDNDACGLLSCQILEYGFLFLLSLLTMLMSEF